MGNSNQQKSRDRSLTEAECQIHRKHARKRGKHLQTYAKTALRFELRLISLVSLPDRPLLGLPAKVRGVFLLLLMPLK